MSTMVRPQPASRRGLKRAKECMSAYPETIRPAASVQEAAARMRAFDLGFLPVVDHDRVVGVVTDRDLVTRVLAAEPGPKRLTVADIMSEDPVFCGPESTLNAVMKTMAT